VEEKVKERNVTRRAGEERGTCVWMVRDSDSTNREGRIRYLYENSSFFVRYS